MFQRLISVGVAALLIVFALPAFADDDKQGDAHVVVLEFETFNVEEDVLEDFYVTLEGAINEHDEMQVAPGGDVTIGDLALTMGCEDVTPECLQGLEGHVEGDRLVFGSVEHAEGVYMVSMRMFDFAEGEFVRELEDETIEADADAVPQGLSAVIEGFMYGDVGTLEVSTNGAEEAEVAFDGEKLGRAPLTAENLPLGEHVVTIRTPDGEEESKKATLQRNSTSRVHFDLSGSGSGQPVASSDTSALPGWLAVAAGAAGITAGILNANRAQRYDTDAARMICGDALCSDASATEANELQANMDSAHTMSVIGYSVGAIGLAAGGYLLYDAYSSGAGESDAGESTLSFEFAPSTDGASFGLGLEF